MHWERKPGEHPGCVREPLKRSHLERHLTAEGPYVGLACITPGEATTRIAVLDFDSHKGEVPFAEMMRTVNAVTALMRTQGQVPHVFRSSGGNGVHVIALWDEPQDAYSVRENLTITLNNARLRPGTKGVAKGEVEVFPKQDQVELDGVGSMFILPFAGKSEYLGGELPAAWDVSAPVPMLERATTVQTSSIIDDGSQSTSLAELRAALAAIPNEGAESLEYDSWRNVIFALHHATGGSEAGLALAHEFSSRSAKYDPTFLDERVWPYVRSERGGTLITARTVFDMAHKHGYVEDVSLGFEDLDAGGSHEQKVTTEQPAAEGASSPSTQPAGEAGSQQAPGTSSKAAGTRFAVVPALDFSCRKPPRWIVRGVLPQVPVATIIGQAGTGKSFIALDLVAAIARGLPWRGHKVRPGRVVYVAAEGAGGFRNRLVAYGVANGTTFEELPIGVVPDAPNLLQKDDARDLVLAVRAFGKTDVIVVDTLAQIMPGGDENSSEDMGRVLGHCKAVHKHTGATVLLVHHVGKDQSKGARGWSGLFGNVDAELTVERDAYGRSVRVSKMKDGVDGAVYPFRLRVVEIGKDEEGEVIDSCVVEHQESEARAAKKAEPKGDLQRSIWRSANDLAGLDDGAMPVSALIDNVVAGMVHDPSKRDRRRELATRAIQGMTEQGFFSVENGQLRVVEQR